MIRSEFLHRTRLDADTLERWVADGWLLPKRGGDDVSFGDIDVARAQLIRDLKEDLGVNDEGVAVVLDLVDQIHGVRQMARSMLAVVWAQPDSTRQQIFAQLGQTWSRGSRVSAGGQSPKGESGS